MDFFLKYKIIILRTLGIVMLVASLAAYFWTTPKEGLSANEKAAANIARMEARASGASSGAVSNENKFLEELKNKQAEQAEYLVIIIMILGVGFLGYSFMPKKED